MSIFKNNVVVGIAAGLAAAVIAPVLIPALKRGSRPLAKSLVKGGIILYDKGREVVAGAGEMMEDVIAEVHAETYEKQASMMTEAGDANNQASAQHFASNGMPTSTSEKNGPTPVQVNEGGIP